MPSYPHYLPPSYESIQQPNAITPLTTRKDKPRTTGKFKVFYVSLAVIVLALFLAQNLGLVRCPLDDVPAEEKAKLRRQWKRDLTKWTRERDRYVAEQRTWEQERATRRAEREEEEKHRLEVVRRSQGVYWTEPRAERCHSYGTRIYSANLRDIPGDLNWLEVCENMPPVTIHGREISKPSKCEWNGGDVVGTWYIDFDEPSCKPYWNDFTDLGCNVGNTGFQRFGARLDGMSNGADWNLMCSTTAATIRGVHFDQPTTCEDRGRWGEVGLWDVPNPGCR
ncbi:hypothetical protein VTO73DRAFT_4703 [Trametes versicolor]